MALNLVAGMQVAERFRLERVLGQGGMGVVWLAYDERLHQPCAIKFIDADEGYPGLRERFAREARAAASLKSQHVVQILDHGEWRAIPYIAMELLEGEDLAHRLHRLGRLSPRETLRIIEQVGRALTKAHAREIVHRDLKPENIFLVRDDDQEIAKVLDFGIAKVREPNALQKGQTGTGSIIGTLHYMSPEQARGDKDIDHRSDLWSLAVITFECLTGKKPFQGELGEAFVAILASPLPVPSAWCPDLPAGFDAWWLRAASRDRAARYGSARELVEGLGHHLGLSLPRAADPGGQSGAWPASPAPGPEASGGLRVSMPSLDEGRAPLAPRPSDPALIGQPSTAGMAATMAGTLPLRRSPWPLIAGAAALGLLAALAALWVFVVGPGPGPAATLAAASPASSPAVPPATPGEAAPAASSAVPLVLVVPAASAASSAAPEKTTRPAAGRPPPEKTAAPGARTGPKAGAMQCDEFGICTPKK